MACHATYARFDGLAPAHRIHFDDARKGYPAGLSTLWVERGFQRLLEIAAALPGVIDRARAGLGTSIQRPASSCQADAICGRVTGDWRQEAGCLLDLYVNPLEPEEIGAARKRLEARGS